MATPSTPSIEAVHPARSTRPARLRRARRLGLRVVALLAVTLGVVLAVGEGTAHAAPGDEPAPVQPVPPIEPIQPIDPIGAPAPGVPAVPEIPVSADRVSESFARLVDDGTGGGDGDTGTTLAIDVPGSEDSSNIVVIILVLTVLSVAPSVLILMTSFTRIVIVLSLTRQALGIPQLPPQQVIVGLSLFLTLFIMGPTLSVMNEEALQPLLSGEIELGDALSRAEAPIREFMLQSTREAELELFLDASDLDGPITRDEVPLTALVPAFVLSELKAAFILGFVIFVPFLVIDLVTSAVLVSLGMMMLPPTFVSLPMKLLLFILLDGFSLVIGTLLNST